jgi:hypothetical protein
MVFDVTLDTVAPAGIPVPLIGMPEATPKVMGFCPPPIVRVVVPFLVTEVKEIQIDANKAAYVALLTACP